MLLISEKCADVVILQARLRAAEAAAAQQAATAAETVSKLQADMQVHLYSTQTVLTLLLHDSFV
jgi:hypothetical protein